MKNIDIIFDPPHGSNVAGKGSPAALYPKVFPDDQHLWFREYKFNRQNVIAPLTDELQQLGYNVGTTNASDEEYFSSSGKIWLGKRVDIANNLFPARRKLLISPHTNAAGMGNRWQTLKDNRNFFCVFTTNGQTKSDIFAEYVYEEISVRFPDIKGIMDKSDGDMDLESNFTVLTGANYYAALIEFGFQDIRQHVQFLLVPENIRLYRAAIVAAIERFNNYFNS